VEAFALKTREEGKGQRKNWIPAFAGMTRKGASAGGVEALAIKNKKSKEQGRNWIPAFAGMTSGEQELDSSLRWNDELGQKLYARLCGNDEQRTACGYAA